MNTGTARVDWHESDDAERWAAGAADDIEILISPAAPSGGTKAVWLPAPRSGRPFLLSFRAYRPKPAMLDGDFLLPELRPA